MAQRPHASSTMHFTSQLKKFPSTTHGTASQVSRLGFEGSGSGLSGLPKIRGPNIDPTKRTPTYANSRIDSGHHGSGFWFWSSRLRLRKSIVFLWGVLVFPDRLPMSRRGYEARWDESRLPSFCLLTHTWDLSSPRSGLQVRGGERLRGSWLYFNRPHQGVTGIFLYGRACLRISPRWQEGLVV